MFPDIGFISILSLLCVCFISNCIEICATIKSKLLLTSSAKRCENIQIVDHRLIKKGENEG